MSKQLFSNNASSVLTVGVNTTFTTLTLSDASRFPLPTAGDWFMLSLIGLNVNGQEDSWEVVKCTNRSSNVLTVDRAQEGTTGVAWGAGTRAEVRITSVFANQTSDHFVNTTNPHSVTKTQVGLGNVDNTSDATKNSDTATLTNKTLTNPAFSGTTANMGSVTTIDLNGGTIDGTVIGATTPADGSFTTLSASGEICRPATVGESSLRITYGSGITYIQSSGNAGTGSGALAFGGYYSTAFATLSTSGLSVTGVISATANISASKSNSQYKLDIDTSGVVNHKSEGWGAVQKWSVRDASNNYSEMTLDAAGNLGIGVVPSGWYATYKVVQINSNMALWANGDHAHLGNNVRVDAAGSDVYLTNDYATKYRQVNGNHAWHTAPSGTAGDSIPFTQAMTLDASGNLGIGVVPTTRNNTALQIKDGIGFPATQVASSDANTLDDYREATYTATATGMTTAPTGTVSFVRVGNMVTLNIPAITGTSNATTFTLTGGPTTMRPGVTRTAFVRVQDNSGAYAVGLALIDSTGVISLFKDAAANAFTASGTKSTAAIQLSYII